MSAQFKVERRSQTWGLLPSTLERNSVYSYGPATAAPARPKAPGTVVPPPMVSTTRMPLPVVNAPAPVVLVTFSSELPVACRH